MRMAMIGPVRVVGGATVHNMKIAVNCYVTRITIPDVEIMKLKTPPLDMEIKVNGSADTRLGGFGGGFPVASGDEVTVTFSEPIEYFIFSVRVVEDTDLCAIDEFKRWIERRPNKPKDVS